MPNSRECLHTKMEWNASLMYINHALLLGSGFIIIPTMRPSRPKAAPLYYAAQLGFHDLAKYLLTERPKDAHAKGGHYVTPMHASVSAGHIDIFFTTDRAFSQMWTSEADGGKQTPPHEASSIGQNQAAAPRPQCRCECPRDRRQDSFIRGSSESRK